MENMKLEGYEPVVYIKEEYTNISALNPIDLNIQDEEDEIGDKSEHKVYCSLTVVNPEEITCDSVGSDDYNSDWVFGLQSNTTVVTTTNNNTATTTPTPTNAPTTDGNQLPPLNIKNNELTPQLLVECELSNDSTFSRLNDNSSSDNSNMYTYYSLPNDSSLVNFSHPESPHKKADFKEGWNNVVPEPKKVITKAEKTPPIKKTFPCPICNKVFASKSNLERHGVVHCDVKPFQCVECKRMFSRRVHLERHKFLHMDQKPFNCEICKKGFTQKTHLEKHQYIHTGVKPFECLLCNKSFARKESLNRHKAIHAANEKKAAAAAVAAAAAAVAGDNKDDSIVNVINNIAINAVKEEITETTNTAESDNSAENDNSNKNNSIDTLESSVKTDAEVHSATKVANNINEIKIEHEIKVENDTMETTEIVE